MQPIMIWGKNRKSGWHIDKIRQYQGEKRRFVSKFTSQEMKSTAYWLTTCPTHLCKLSSNGYLDTFTETPCFLQTKTQIHIKTDSETARRHETLECERTIEDHDEVNDIQYTPRNIHNIDVLLCFVVVLYRLILHKSFPFTSLALESSCICSGASEANLTIMSTVKPVV